MCDFATLQVIESVVAEKTQRGELFTAFDVTKAVRAQVGRSVPVPHNDVKQEVHNLFASGQMVGYTRTLGNLNLPSGVQQPWVYHQTTSDPSTYGTTVIDPPSQLSSNDDGVNQTKDGYYKVDARETLCVPKHLVEGLGLYTGDEAYVSADALAGHLVVTKNVPDATVLTSLSSYKVDAYGNVRITQHTLQKGGCGGKQYEIDGDTTKVFVRKHS